MASSTNNEKIEKERPTTMHEGKNIHSSPVDGKLLCSFSEKTCMQRRLNRYAFCIRHVLEDKSSPFKQCKFVAKYNGQRCTNAIPLKEDRMWVSLLGYSRFWPHIWWQKFIYIYILSKIISCTCASFFIKDICYPNDSYKSIWHSLLCRLDIAIVICKS
jgi:hypothetical protein